MQNSFFLAAKADVQQLQLDNKIYLPLTTVCSLKFLMKIRYRHHITQINNISPPSLVCTLTKRWWKILLKTYACENAYPLMFIFFVQTKRKFHIQMLI